MTPAERKVRAERDDLCMRCVSRAPAGDAVECAVCLASRRRRYDQRAAERKPSEKRCGLCRQVGHFRQRCDRMRAA